MKCILIKTQTVQKKQNKKAPFAQTEQAKHTHPHTTCCYFVQTGILLLSSLEFCSKIDPSNIHRNSPTFPDTSGLVKTTSFEMNWPRLCCQTWVSTFAWWSPAVIDWRLTKRRNQRAEVCVLVGQIKVTHILIEDRMQLNVFKQNKHVWM